MPLGGDLGCVRCGSERDAGELDRHLWCDPCVAAARGSARRVGWLAGALLAVLFALWIYFAQRPSTLLLGGWLGAVAATLWLGSRVGAELAYGVQRIRHRPR